MMLSGLLCFGLTFLLWKKSIASTEFVIMLNSYIGIFIGISGFIAFSILSYLFFSVFIVQKIRNTSSDKTHGLVEKMNIVREIADTLLTSKLWLPGVKEYIDEEYEGLTFFEVKEYYKGKSKLAIEFLEEKRNYAETEILYLELKSLLMTEPRQKKIPTIITVPEYFKKDIIEKWIEHKVGSGLWYYFGYKFGSYKNALDIENVFERHQDKIMNLAVSLDKEAFEDSSFNEVFFSKLGEYINKNLLPKLHQQSTVTKRFVPGTLQFLFTIFAAIIALGVMLPLLFVLFQLPSIVLLFSISFVISILFFFTLTIYPFLLKNINS